mmetsp:Transcript_6788/g.30601  ORF Transcript_6788/g.30601 Transcript_6788/m.30601 type:complete len:215 (-) Transcript_6788:67-711(-)
MPSGRPVSTDSRRRSRGTTPTAAPSRRRSCGASPSPSASRPTGSKATSTTRSPSCDCSATRRRTRGRNGTYPRGRRVPTRTSATARDAARTRTGARSPSSSRTTSAAWRSAPRVRPRMIQTKPRLRRGCRRMPNEAPSSPTSGTCSCAGRTGDTGPRRTGCWSRKSPGWTGTPSRSSSTVTSTRRWTPRRSGSCPKVPPPSGPRSPPWGTSRRG